MKKKLLWEEGDLLSPWGRSVSTTEDLGSLAAVIMPLRWENVRDRAMCGLVARLRMENGVTAPRADVVCRTPTHILTATRRTRECFAQILSIFLYSHSLNFKHSNRIPYISISVERFK